VDIFTDNEREIQYDDIRKNGFVTDGLLGSDADLSVYGVNLTCAWPLPQETKTVYQALARDLSTLSELYVYPYEQTHITILTIVNFKKNRSGQAARLGEATLDMIEVTIRDILETGVGDIELSVAAPVLTREVVFLPVFDSSGMILKIRRRIYEALHAENDRYDLDRPITIHSTIARFERRPEDAEEFINRFKRISQGFPGCSGKVSEILVTEELWPYMRVARVARRIN
jgi:hypothetical protein